MEALSEVEKELQNSQRMRAETEISDSNGSSASQVKFMQQDRLVAGESFILFDCCFLLFRQLLNVYLLC